MGVRLSIIDFSIFLCAVPLQKYFSLLWWTSWPIWMVFKGSGKVLKSCSSLAFQVWFPNFMQPKHDDSIPAQGKLFAPQKKWLLLHHKQWFGFMHDITESSCTCDCSIIAHPYCFHECFSFLDLITAALLGYFTCIWTQQYIIVRTCIRIFIPF